MTNGKTGSRIGRGPALAAVCLTLPLGLAGAAHAWSQAQPATRIEVAAAAAELPDDCRPLVEMRFRARIMREGRPLSRRETRDTFDGLKGCAAISEQLAGFRDG